MNTYRPVGLYVCSLLELNSVCGKGFLFSESSTPAVESAEPTVWRVPGAHFPELKRLGREADYSSLSSAEVKKQRCCYTVHLPSTFSACGRTWKTVPLIKRS